MGESPILIREKNTSYDERAKTHSCITTDEQERSNKMGNIIKTVVTLLIGAAGAVATEKVIAKRNEINTDVEPETEGQHD